MYFNSFMQLSWKKFMNFINLCKPSSFVISFHINLHLINSDNSSSKYHNKASPKTFTKWDEQIIVCYANSR